MNKLEEKESTSVLGTKKNIYQGPGAGGVIAGLRALQNVDIWRGETRRDEAVFTVASPVSGQSRGSIKVFV